MAVNLRTLSIYGFLILAPLAFFWGCGKGAPVSPVSNSSVSVTVPLKDVHGQSFSSIPVSVLYCFSSGVSGQPVTGVAGTVPVSSNSFFSFNQTLPTGTVFSYVAIQLNDYNNNVIALGATTFSGNMAPVTLGPVNKSTYQVTLGAGQAFGFEPDNKVNVGLNPTPTPGWGLDVLCNTTSTGFELDCPGLSASTVAYLGNGPFLDYLTVPAATAFKTTSTASKALVTTSTDVAPGDVFCVKMNGGGYAWLQAQTVTGSGIYFQYRVNTTLQYCGYEQTTADQANPNPVPTATATVLAQVTIAATSSTIGTTFTPYDIALYGPTNSAATTVFASNSANGYIYIFDSALSMSTSFTGTGLVQPEGLAIDPAGSNLYVADPTGQKVSQFSIANLTSNGSIGSGVVVSSSDTTGQANNGALAKPRYGSFDNSGNLFITDAGTAGVADMMEYLGPTIPVTATTNVNYWTGSLSASASTTCVGQIANAGSTVIVADSANNRIGLYQTNGTLIRNLTLDNNPGGAVNFSNPQGVAYSSSTGYLYISDTGNNRIVELTLSGSFVRILGSSFGFNGPTGLKLDNAQPPNLYVADTGNGRILKLQ